MVARIDAADSAPPGQADVPRPPRLVRRGDRIAFDRHVGTIVGQLARERAVGEQLVLPAPERRLQRAAAQFGADTRTVAIKKTGRAHVETPVTTEHPVCSVRL